ncbi:MAG: trigger factor, partial [bacterium]|nr:trigger factor [bacterium]
MPHSHEHKHEHHFKLKEVKKLENSEAEITGEIDLPFLVLCRKKAIKDINKNIELPGFRAGNIPEDILVKKVGEMAVLEEAAEIAMAEQYPHIVEEAKLLPIGRPHISVTKLAPNIATEFKVKVYVEPEFTLPDYKKLAKGTVEEDKEKRRGKILEELIKETKIDVPAVLIESELSKMLAQFQDEVGRAQVKWEDYLKEIKKTEADVRAEWREDAIKRVKVELIIIKIAERELIEPSAEEIDKEAEHIISHFPDAEPLRAKIFAYTHIRNQKVLTFLESLK